MIRRDYLLRMIDQCLQALARSLALSRQGAFDQARVEVDQALRELTGLEAKQISRLSEAELMALLLRGEPTQILGQKVMCVVALLREAGQTYAGEGDLAESRACHLKALNLQLNVLLREGPFEVPDFVPSLESLVSTLQDQPLPFETLGALMQYYERIGLFAKAEDTLFLMLQQEPSNPGLTEFGLQFYQRLLRQSDDALEAGNLPRNEVEAGLGELRAGRDS